MFRQINPANRDEPSVEAAGGDFGKYFGYVEHFLGEGPFCVGNTPSLGDCALAPTMMLMKKVIFPNFAPIKDPTAGDGRRNPYKSVFVRAFELTAAERQDLLAFLRALTDESVRSNPAFSDPFVHP